jgi:hypothetical protein
VRLPENFSDMVAHASLDVQARTLGVIQRDTSVTWAARAEAALVMYSQTRVPHWLSDATEYYHESIEHAALSGDVELLESIRDRLGPAFARTS